jgi:hypothetical protein
MIYEFKNPIPVTTPMGDGYILYVRDGGTWENDIFAVVLTEGGMIRHFRSDQLNVWANATFGIEKDSTLCQKTTPSSPMPNCLH